MKKAWRWPLAGFVLGGLVGATFLTVNVVGASSPERRRRHGQLVRGDPAHAASARGGGSAGRAQLRPRLRPDEGRARRDVLAEGLRLRSRVRDEQLRRAPARAGARRASVRGGLGRERRIRLLRRARQRPRRDRDAAGGGCQRPAARLAAPRAGRRSTWERSPSERRDRLPRSSRSSPGARAARRSGSTAARSSRGSGRRHSTSLQMAPSSCSTR